MERIRIIDLEKSFGIAPVFSNVSFEIKQGDRLGLVGPNGAGKSTLLKCILGLEERDGGQVIQSPVATIGYLQQDVDLGDASLAEEISAAWADVHRLEEQLEALMQAMAEGQDSEDNLQRLDYLQNRLEWLGGYDYEQKTKRIVYGLGFTDEDLDKPASSFSGGQKTRINLAKALVRQPDFLFLDEPTNHLDMEMLEWLEGYLRSYQGGILLVSHDRYFMDRIVTGVVELNHHKATTYRGNYSRYLRQREERAAADLAAYEKQQEYIKKTEEYIEKYRAGIKSKMARGRQSQLNRLERLEAPETTATLRFTFPPAEMSADRVLRVEHAYVGYEANHPIVKDVNFEIRRGESVALIGPNGAGKSTLVKAIVGDLFPQEGDIRLGNRVNIGYFSQEHEELHEQWQVVEEVMNSFNYSEDKARHVLGAFLFRGDDVFKRIGDLSGGERARVALLKLFLQGHNFLVLDEPTNHLDIPTREVVESALKEFNGTCFIISHDRYFLDQVATRILAFEDGGLAEYLGNYSAYKERLDRNEAMAREALANQQGALGQGRISNQSNRIKAVEQEVRREEDLPRASSKSGEDTDTTQSLSKPNAYVAEKKLAQVEMDIARVEATIKMYEVQLQNPAVQSDMDELATLASQLEEENQKLEALYEQWALLSE